MTVKEKLQKFRNSKKAKKNKFWKVETKTGRTIFVVSCGNANEEEVMSWWNNTEKDECIKVCPYESETRDWIIMPTLTISK